jgi:uncharacterized protein with gpF-like domain
MFNLQSTRAKQRYWLKYARTLLKFENQMRIDVGKVLYDQYTDASKEISDGNIQAIGLAVRSHYPEMVVSFERNFRSILTFILEDVLKDVEDLGKSYNPIFERKDIPYDFWNYVNNFIKIHTSSRVTQINQTTINIIRKIINKGLNEGKSDNEIAKDLNEVKEISTLTRSKRIARTEMHTAANSGIQHVVKQTGLVQTKEWVAALDERVRPEHGDFYPLGANGEVVDFNDTYNGTGEPLRFPGDPSGSAWNIINCRCVEVYHTREVF